MPARLLRTSERTTFKRCRWQWDRAYGDKLRPHTTAPALRFGTLVHQALERYYVPGLKRGPHPAQTFAKLYNKELKTQMAFGFRDEDGEWHNALELGVDLLEHYVEHWGDDRRYKVIASEQTFKMPVMHPRTGRVWFYYVGTVDGIWYDREKKRLVIVDHKTATAISTHHLALDEQAGAYWTFGVDWLRQEGLLKPSQKLEAILFNFLRKAKRDTRPQNADGHYLNKPAKKDLVAWYDAHPARKRPAEMTVEAMMADLGDKALQLGEVSKTQPPAWFHREPVFRDEADRNAVRERVLQEAQDMALIRKGRSAAYKAPGQMVCGGCGFKDICELHETGADWETMRDATMESWDPYDAHEIEIAEKR